MSGETHGSLSGPLEVTDDSTMPNPAPLEGEQQDPVAAGVDEERAIRWAIFDTVTRSYLEPSVRTRPPTDKMRSDLERLNAEVGFERAVWHRV